METQLRGHRVDIDRYINSIQLLNPSREISLVKTNLQESKAFVGLCLKDLGTNNPYPDSHNPGNVKIAPEADKAPNDLSDSWSQSYPSQTKRVKDLRALIETRLELMKAFYESDAWSGTTWSYVHFREAILKLENAKMWLGWELGRIRTVLEETEVKKDHDYLPLN